MKSTQRVECVEEREFAKKVRKYERLAPSIKSAEKMINIIKIKFYNNNFKSWEKIF